MLTLCCCSKLARYPGWGHLVPEPSKDAGEGFAPHARSFLCPDWRAAFSRAQGSTGKRRHPRQAPAWPARGTTPPPSSSSQKDHDGSKYSVAFCERRNRV